MVAKYLPKLLYAVLASFLFFNISQAQKEKEPNNTPAQANVLPLNGLDSGAINPAGDVDWYKVTTNADGQLFVTYDNTGYQDLKNLTLYDGDTVTVLSFTQIGNGPGSLNYNGLAPGTYFIKASGSSGNETGNYTISDSLAVPSLANDNEPNNSVSEADILPLNGSLTGHYGYYYNHYMDTTDWYKVTTNADGSLYLTLNNTGNYLVNLNLYDFNGTTMLSSTQIGNGIGGLHMNGLAAGTYYVQVTNSGNNWFGPYKLSDSLASLSIPNDHEPNDNISEADLLPLNDSVTGHYGYYYNNHRDTSDWYKLTTIADGNLFLTFNNTGNYLVNLNLYDTTGSPLLSSSQIGNGLGGLEMDGLGAGTYYVQVTDNGNVWFGPYILKDSLAALNQLNDKEPNNNPSEAEPLALNTSTTGHYGYYYNNFRDTSDWYKINITSRGILKIILDNSGNPDLITLNLYDVSGTNIIGSTDVGNGPGEIETDTLSTGIYYIQLYNLGLNNFGPYTLTDTLFSALPVTFTSFNGKLNGDEAILTWSTASEFNNKGFEVEKSEDGENFADIGFVGGHGTSSLVNTYSFTDVKVLSGHNYYRLKQIDIDGNFTYSSTIRLDFSQFSWAIFGNPLSANSWIQLQVTNKSNIIFQVYTADGKLIQSVNKGTLSTGTYSIPLNLGNAASGIYVVKLVSGNQVFSKEVVK